MTSQQSIWFVSRATLASCDTTFLSLSRDGELLLYTVVLIAVRHQISHLSDLVSVGRASFNLLDSLLQETMWKTVATMSTDS